MLHNRRPERTRASATYLGIRKSARVRYIPGEEEERARPLHTWGWGRALHRYLPGDEEERARPLNTWWWKIPRARVRYIPGDKEERAHGMHVAEGRLRLGHLDGSDAEAPEVAPVVVRGVRVLVAGDHLGGHPVGRPDKGVPEQDTRLVSLPFPF